MSAFQKLNVSPKHYLQSLFLPASEGRKRVWSIQLKLIIIIIIIIIIIMYRLYSATLLKDPAALYNKSDINIKSIE